jgi:hypothetical protein
MKKVVSFIIIFFLAYGIMQAQEKSTLGYKPSSYYTFSWNVTFPMGDFHKWVSEPSAAGFDFGGRYMLPKNLMAGFNLGWMRVAKIYEHETYTIPDQGIAITAKNYRFTWMTPFQGFVGYNFIPEKLVSPYAGLGIGGDYMEHHLLIQEYDIYETYWDFSLTPEVGALVKFGPYSPWGALVAFNYKWTTNKIDLYETTSKNLQMLDLKIGISYIIR